MTCHPDKPALLKFYPALREPYTTADGDFCKSCRTNQAWQQGPPSDRVPPCTAVNPGCGGGSQVVENRLFSEGLHVLGRPPTEVHLAQYLSAFFDKGLGPHAVDAVVQARSGGLEAVRRASPASNLFLMSSSATMSTRTAAQLCSKSGAHNAGHQSPAGIPNSLTLTNSRKLIDVACGRVCRQRLERLVQQDSSAEESPPDDRCRCTLAAVSQCPHLQLAR